MKMQFFTYGVATICASLAIFMLLRGGPESDSIPDDLSNRTVETDIRQIAVGAPETRELVLRGKLAKFWQVVDQKAPEDLDYVVSRFFEARSSLRTSEDVRKKLDRELLAYRLRLAKYSQALSDKQRIDIINARIQFLQIFDDPKTCALVARHGAGNLNYDQLSLVYLELDQVMATMVSHLIDARASGDNNEANALTLPTDEDYDQLVDRMKDGGWSDLELQPLLLDTWRDPEYCQIYLSYLENVAAMPGKSGAAIRVDEIDGFLQPQ
ncbi:hypothetical protein SAMN05444358_1011860 [Ruegeria halocynthiae]|uniref:Uncharacterized protein n=1 Tax=Ruegeria halocynthiae TaxID=985054 RepID=A0A1H2WQ84_9RHOB|nr:hypothetical protein [Ruegeria halocynthiae]SDW82424.1 hypothetical protein SAMN05444358_1011860 [Ruegeria halocynthiae]